MPRQRIRRRVEREAAEILGDDYKFTNDPELAAKRAEARRKRREEAIGRPSRWVRCMIRGCTQDLTPEPGFVTQVCPGHAVEIWEVVEQRDQHPYLREHLAAEIARRDAVRAEARAAAKAEVAGELRKPDAQGDIYFVRTNGFVKVGWTSDLLVRLRSYGPSAELLVHYRATRADETELHRQLKPALAKGREWYADGDVIALFIERALAEHGEPETRFAKWTGHDGAKVKPKSWR